MNSAQMNVGSRPMQQKMENVTYFADSKVMSNSAMETLERCYFANSKPICLFQEPILENDFITTCLGNEV